MLVSHEKKFIYLKTIKTAGTSVEGYFEKYCVEPDSFKAIEARDQSVSDYGIVGYRGSRLTSHVLWAYVPARILKRLGIKPRFWNHMPAKKLKEIIGNNIWNKYYKFCVIRNPFDKVVSHFWHTVSGSQRENLVDASFDSVRSAFSEYVQKRNFPMDRNIYTLTDRVAVDYLIRYEDLLAGVEKVCRDLNIVNESELPKYKTSHRVRDEYFADYYAPETAMVVANEYSWELEQFGYESPL